MRARTSSALAASLVLALAAGPLAATQAFAAPPAATASVSVGQVADGRDGLDEKALRDAVAGLPERHATAALVRVGGIDGTWRGSAGVRDLTSGRPADPNALFRAGSVTKVVTAATVLRLAAQGRVDLDAPVGRYLPDLLTPAFDKPISVRQLLNHTSGIPAGDGLGDDFTQVYAHRFDTPAPERVVASALAKGPEFDPGRQQHYLNINYTVLGLLIEKVTDARTPPRQRVSSCARPACGTRTSPAPTRASGARTTGATRRWSGRTGRPSCST